VTSTPAPSDWLSDAICYEIYPQSFADSGGDGIGDMPGVLAHLDHLQWLGVDTIWFNPCFASPFVDAGYDVSDYLSVAPRYGTNEDLVRVVEGARARGIRVLLDLVAGHTSLEHAWFQSELHLAGPDPDGDRYVWTTDPPAPETDASTLAGMPRWVRSPGPRPGYYLKNFYDAQPALNFGYAQTKDGEPWRQPVDAPGPLRNRTALREVMAFWLDRGVAGFRVDMAFSLVKDDPGYRETVALWRELRAWLDHAYPAAVIIPEGVEPRTGSAPAFHADFFLVINQPHSSLFNNGGAGTLPWIPAAPCFFDAGGEGSTRELLSAWDDQRAATPGRPVLLASADHDFSRLACGRRTSEQLGAAFTFLLTWGSVPSIYFGDEIGQRYLPGMPAKEGSICNPGYNRAGARTPMQWDDGPNAGFSAAPADRLYLPVDPAPDRPTVEGQLADPGSTLHLVRRLVALRRSTPALGARDTTTVLHQGYPFAYRCGSTHLVVVNPRREPAAFDLPRPAVARPQLANGVEVRGARVEAAGFGYGVFELTE